MSINLKEIPKGWKAVKIPKVLFFQEGPGIRNWQFKDNGIKLLNVGNINKGQINLNTTSIYLSKEEAYGKYAHFLVNEGDLLIACSGILVDNFHNKIAFIRKEHLPLCLNTSTMRFRELDTSKINLNYFKYYLQTVHFTSQLRRLITGSAQLNFGPSHIKKIDLLLPPLPEQQRIAKILDAADALRKKTQQIIDSYDELAQSIFLDMFGDPVKNEKGWSRLTIRDLALRFSDGPFGSNLKTVHYCDNGIQVIRLQNIGINEFIEKDISHVKTTHYESVLKKYSCYPGDVVIATMGDPNIRACIVPKHINVAVNKADCVLFRAKQELSNPYYISHLLNLEGFLFLATSFIHGQTRARISSGQIAKISIPVPPIELQNQFAKKIELILKQKELAKQSLEESEDLFQSLLQKTFKGELVS